MVAAVAAAAARRGADQPHESATRQLSRWPPPPPPPPRAHPATAVQHRPAGRPPFLQPPVQLHASLLVLFQPQLLLLFLRLSLPPLPLLRRRQGQLRSSRARAVGRAGGVAVCCCGAGQHHHELGPPAEDSDRAQVDRQRSRQRPVVSDRCPGAAAQAVGRWPSGLRSGAVRSGTSPRAAARPAREPMLKLYLQFLRLYCTSSAYNEVRVITMTHGSLQ